MMNKTYIAQKMNSINWTNHKLLLVFAIILLTVCVSVINPSFIAVNNLVTIIQQVTVLGIITMGAIFIILTGCVDLSLGNMMAFCAAVMARLIQAGYSTSIAVAVGACVALTCGLINGFIVSKSRCIPMIITLGLSQVYFGMALILTEGSYIGLQGAFTMLSRTRLFGIVPIMVFVLLLIIAISAVLLNRTKIGRRTVAVGGNEYNAFLSGINVDRVKIFAYIYASFAVFVSAIVFVARLDTVSATAGSDYSLNAMTAAILGGVTLSGGKGSVGGAILGVVFLGMINNAMNILNVWSYAQTAISGVIIVAAIILSDWDKRRKS